MLEELNEIRQYLRREMDTVSDRGSFLEGAFKKFLDRHVAMQGGEEYA